MNTLIKIAGICVILAGLSAPTYALDAVQGDAGQALVFTATTAGLPNLSFTCSGNTFMAATSDATTYSIGAASSKTNATNGIQYGMTQDFNGYYQTTGGGSAPDVSDFSSWTAMGGES